MESPARVPSISDRCLRNRLVAVVLFLLVGPAAAACGGSSPVSGPENDEPSSPLSFAAITGGWEGVIQRPEGGISEWGEVLVAEESAPANEGVGTFDLFVSEDGERLCTAELLARESDPPTYVFAYRTTFGDAEVCVPGGLFKFIHDAGGDELVYFWKAPDSQDFVEWGTFEKVDG